MEFGFLLNSKHVLANDLEIVPRHDFDQIRSKFYQAANATDGWIYPDVRSVPISGANANRFGRSHASVQQPFVALPPTHSLRMRSFDSVAAKFIVLAYGFIHGVYLAPVDHLYINRVPFQEGKLTGVVPTERDLERGLNVISKFCVNASPKQLNAMFAVLHWFLAGQSYQFQWDRFDAQYKVLDGLYKYSGLQRTQYAKHAQRPVDLASRFGIKLPTWAVLSNGRSSILSDIRNELAHEAIYAGKPVGYAYPQINFDLEFVAFNTKIIAATLGFASPYLDAEPEDRNIHGWNFV